MGQPEVEFTDRLSRPSRLRLGALAGAGLAIVAVAAVAAASPSPSATSGSSTTPSAADESAGRAWLDGDGLELGLPGRLGHFGFGGITITAIDGNEVSLETVDGWTRTITIDDDTEIRKGGEDAALGDLAVGDQVRFRQSREDDGSFSIEALVVVQPRIGGEVTAVSGSDITLEQPDGTTGTIHVDDETEVRVAGVEDADVADIEVGMKIVAVGERNDDGSIDADHVFAGDRLRGPGMWRGPRLDAPAEEDDSTEG